MKIIAIAFIAIIMSGVPSSVEAEEKTYTLEDAYRAALSTNELIKIAEENSAQSEYRVDQAWTYLYPRVDGRGLYTKYNKSLPPNGQQPLLFQPESQLAATLVLTQPLYTGGRTLAALRSAQKMRITSNAELAIAKQDMMVNVADAYYAVLKARKTVDISRRSLERMERHHQVTQREAATRKTKANQSALLRANTLVSQAKILLVRSEDALKIARDRLSLLTKLPQDLSVAEPPALEAPSQGLDNLKKSALETRDDYAKSKIDQNIAEENVTIVKGGHYPQLYGEAGMTYASSSPEMVTDATVFYAGLRLQVPIFEGGLMKAEVSEAKSKVRQAELSSEFLRKTIESDVQEAYINLQTLTSVLDTAKIQRDYAQGNYEAVEGLFSEGLLASLSLIDAEQALTAAERELVNASYDREVSILRLERATGRLGKDRQYN